MKRRPLVLIFSSLVEPNVDRIVPLLEKRRARWVRFNVELYPLFSAGSIRLGGEAVGTLRTRSAQVQLDAVTCVWNRRNSRPVLRAGLSAFEERFIENEAAAFQVAVHENLECSWVNDWRAERTASSKSWQLRVAERHGFRVPRTLITNEPKRVRAFMREVSGPVLFKPLAGTSPSTPDYSREVDRWLNKGRVPLARPRADSLNDAPIAFSRLLSARELKKLETVSDCPVVFQEYIPKRVELRVTVVGSDIFACAIDSQAHDSTRVDFRRFALDKRIPGHRRVRIRAETGDRLLAMMRSLGLVFGCFDLIVTPDGEEVFLEVNPAGQWAWIQKYAKLPIDDALADLLVLRSGAGQ